MAKKYTVLLIDGRGSSIRELVVSRKSIVSLLAVLLFLVTLAGVGIYRYSRLHRQLADTKAMQRTLADNVKTIEDQKRQLKKFASDLNQLKSKLIALNDFEHKIRIMANLETNDDSNSLFGVGGSMPTDLDPNAALSNDHKRLVREMHARIKQVEQASAIKRKSFESLLKSLENKRNLLAATPSLRPTDGWISSRFGYRISPFTGRKEFHRGLDIASHKKTPIIAPADGVVTFTGKKWLIGNMLVIEHGYGMKTRYGHLYKILKKRGDKVKRGEVIALMGNTGRSTGPHLHYEVWLNGVPVNPERYILN